MMKDICKEFRIICFFVLCIAFTSCIPEGIELPNVYFVTTANVTNITSDGVTLNGNLGVINTEKAVACGVEYGTQPTSLSISLPVGTVTSDGDFSVTITGLDANTTYYYRAYAVDAGGIYKYGEVRSFKTKIGHEAVDLGLSVKWASSNVGAESPEEYGDYFAWGETKTKSSYSSSNSVTCGLSISELESRGIIGADGNLTATYDAATANWGGNWRMPTLSEIKELINNCTWEWTTMNGVNGRKVTGPNGNSIFLPAAGYRYNESLYLAGSDGYYWSATPSGDSCYACYLGFYSGRYYWYDGYRSYGQAVRPVSE